MSADAKDLYEAADAVMERLPQDAEQLLIGLLEQVRAELRREPSRLGGMAPGDRVEVILGTWVALRTPEESAPVRQAWEARPQPRRKGPWELPYRGVQIGDGNRQVNNF